jgi:hypothetical protein
MIRSTCALVLIVGGALTLAACGKKDDNSGTTSGTAAPPDAPPPPPGVGGPIRGIEDCFAALASAALRSRSASKRTNSDKAAEICPGIAAQVRAGRASRATALTQIRSSFGGGGQVPGPCR